ncbi:MAG: methyltransferase domain-containing protein [Chitinivibrionales bacterium]|nr:methyltransferase domain-containing protein [Chitinivibrionales bacterium]
MVTDLSSNYTSPAGREFTLVAGRFAGINPGSRVLDMGCGYGEGTCNLAQEFRCKITAIDNSKENIAFAKQLAVERTVSHLISFEKQDIFAADYKDEPFELVLAEGGVLSFIGRKEGLSLARSWSVSRGWLAFSDLIFLSEDVPNEVSNVFEANKYHYESEASYRKLINNAGFDIQFICLVPQSGWDNYYAHMAKRLEDQKGFFADKRVKLAFHKEIDIFYRKEAFRYMGYLFCIARKTE